MTERLYIQDIQKVLQYRDRRSVRRWCSNNNVRILSDVGTNKQFVLKEEFEKAISKNYYSNKDVKNSSINVFEQNSNNNTDKAKIYRPQGEYEKQFLSIFTNLIPTL